MYSALGMGESAPSVEETGEILSSVLIILALAGAVLGFSDVAAFGSGPGTSSGSSSENQMEGGKRRGALGWASVPRPRLVPRLGAACSAASSGPG